MTTTTDLSMTPYQVADETFVVPWILEAPPVGLFPMNSLVIRGAEPVIVDTGSPANREQWLNNVWNLVDPMDVRWIFLSHDDRDHAGNLLPVLAACPNATLLTNWFSIGRMAEEWMTPLDRCRFLNDGERREIEMMRMDAERAREQSQRALQEAEMARQQLLMEKNNGVLRVEGDVIP